MDFEKYLFPDSPFLRPLNRTLYASMVKDIKEGEYPQDAIAGNMMEDFVPTSGPKLAELWMKKDKRFKVSNHDIANFTMGFGSPLQAINIALRAKEFSEREVENYILHRLKDDTGYYMMHYIQLKNHFLSDWTCSDIFVYVQRNPPNRNDFTQLGIESARIEFGVYSMAILMDMQQELNNFEIGKIWGYL